MWHAFFVTDVLPTDAYVQYFLASSCLVKATVLFWSHLLAVASVLDFSVVAHQHFSVDPTPSPTVAFSLHLLYILGPLGV